MPKNGRKKGGIKAFTKLTLSERVPNFVYLKSAATNEKLFLKVFELERGTIGVFDKGFHNFSQYDQWSGQGIYYVTRANKNAEYEVLAHRELSGGVVFGVRKDMDIRLQYVDKKTGEAKTTKARLVEYVDPVSGKQLTFLTNMFDVSALTVCMLYKNRWIIESLFRQIKQNFELTYFLSDSPEGVKTQIIIALILNLIFTVIHKIAKEAENFSTMVSLAARNAASYIPFVEFLRRAGEFAKKILDDIEKIQLELFEDSQGGGFSATPTNPP